MPFDVGPWVYGYIGLFVLVHVALFYYLVRRRSTTTAGPRAVPEGVEVPDPPSDLEPVDAEGTIQCQHCGVENEPTFRYCRYCIGEIGSGSVSTDSDQSPQGRRMF